MLLDIYCLLVGYDIFGLSHFLPLFFVVVARPIDSEQLHINIFSCYCLCLINRVAGVSGKDQPFC